MSEVGKAEQRILQFNRLIRTHKFDFETKKEKKIFDFFIQYPQFIKGYISTNDVLNDIYGLNADDSKDRVISDEDIENFLAKCKQGDYEVNGKKIKTKNLKNITADDLKNFLTKLLDLNPTELELAEKNLKECGFTDESGENILNKDILNLLKSKSFSMDTVESDYEKENKEYKLFDLNEDGKIDNLEYQFWSGDPKHSIKKGLSQIDSQTKDKKITSEEKNKIYQKLIQAEKERNISYLSNLSLKDEHGNEVITDEVKSLFNIQKTEISIDDLTDENGNIKSGLELFDLNGDKKLDEKERAYFSSQGKIVGAKDKITLGDFTKILENLQLFDISKDGLTDSERQILHKYIESAFIMLDGLEKMPDGVKELYETAMSEISFIGDESDIIFAGRYDTKMKNIRLKDYNDKSQIAETLIHELTHYICTEMTDKEMKNLTQEVECFYITSMLHNQIATGENRTGRRLVEAYEATSLKENNPEISELDIAKFLFMKYHYDFYSHYYKENDKSLVYNAEYRDIGGYFKEDKNKKAIYEAGIQKAFNGLELYDENGNNLITDELKNLFTPEKPIIGYNDLLDENGNIKEGLELFKALIDDPKGEKAKNYFSMITYNDIPRLVKLLKKMNVDAENPRELFTQTDKTSDILTPEKRKFFIDEVADGRFRYKFDYHQK